MAHHCSFALCIRRLIPLFVKHKDTSWKVSSSKTAAGGEHRGGEKSYSLDRWLEYARYNNKSITKCVAERSENWWQWRIFSAQESFHWNHLGTVSLVGHLHGIIIIPHHFIVLLSSSSFSWDGVTPEDWWFCNKAADIYNDLPETLKPATMEDEIHFSSESIFSERPFGVHKYWISLPPGAPEMIKLLENCPENLGMFPSEYLAYPSWRGMVCALNVTRKAFDQRTNITFDFETSCSPEAWEKEKKTSNHDSSALALVAVLYRKSNIIIDEIRVISNSTSSFSIFSGLLFVEYCLRMTKTPPHDIRT